MTKSVAINRRAQRRRGDTLRTLVATILVAAAIVAVGLVTLHTVPGVTTPVELKILGIALAVGLDVLALSIAIGVMKIPWSSRIRLGLAFSVSEVLMQLIGYGIGTGAGRLIGTIANYLGFAVLAGVGVFIFRESFESKDSPFKVDSGWGLIARRPAAAAPAPHYRWSEHRSLYDRRARVREPTRATVSTARRARGGARAHCAGRLLHVQHALGWGT
jgi:hypothetical protein